MGNPRIFLEIDENRLTNFEREILRPLHYDLVRLFNIQSNNEAVANKLLALGLIERYEKSNDLDPAVPRGVGAWAAKFFDLISARGNAGIHKSLEAICNLTDVSHYSEKVISLLAVIDGVKITRQNVRRVSVSRMVEPALTPEESTDTQLNLANIINTRLIIPFKHIKGTELFTGVYYRIRNRRFPSGWIGWQEDGSTGTCYVHMDGNPNNLDLYREGGPLHDAALWMFSPGRSPSETDSADHFVLRNGAKPNLAWALSSLPVDDYGKHVTLADCNERDDKSLLKLNTVSANENGKVCNYVQLKIKAVPEGVLTWSYKSSGNAAAHYIQVDTCEEEQRKELYKRVEDGWAIDTLFRFEPVGAIIESDRKVYSSCQKQFEINLTNL